MEIVLNANGTTATFSNFSAFEDKIIPVVNQEALFYSDFGEEKIVINHPFDKIEYTTTAWTYLGSPIKVRVALDFDGDSKVLLLTVDIEKNREDLLPHPEVGINDLPVAGCTVPNVFPEERKQCEEQSKFWRRILNILSDIRITVGKPYGKEIGQISSCFDLSLTEKMRTSMDRCFNGSFRGTEDDFKDSMLNYGLKKFVPGVPGVISENLPYKHIKSMFTVESDKGSILGNLSIYFDKSSQVEFIYIGTEHPSWMPRRSYIFDCGYHGDQEMGCKKQVLTMEKIVEVINVVVDGGPTLDLSNMLEHADIVWKLDREGPTPRSLTFLQFRDALRGFFEKEGIQKFVLERNDRDYINERDSVSSNWIGKTGKGDVVIKVTLGYDFVAARNGGNGIKSLLFEYKN